MKPRSGGNILVSSLIAHGARTAFCVPGESYLDVLDALHGETAIRLVTCRHESGAAFMAEAYAKLTGRPGLCFVTRGPGACNAAIGLHTAMQDSTPMILFIGQVAREHRGREAFQEIDYRKMFQPPICKWVVEIERADDIPQTIDRAFAAALSGRPGPIVVALPEDMLCEDSAAAVGHPLPLPPPATPAPAAMEDLAALLRKAEKPLLILGGGLWDAASIHHMEAFCAKANIPAAVTFRRQDAFSNTHPMYAGALGTTVDQKLLQAVREADLILAVGTRLSEIATQGYTVIAAPQPAQTLVHVYPDAAELGRVYKARLPIHAAPGPFAEALQNLSCGGESRNTYAENLHKAYLDFSAPPKGGKYALDLDNVIAHLAETLPEDAVVTTDAGNFSGWPQRYLRYSRPMRLLAPTSGAMGYGVPSAIAASLAFPGRTVVGFMGDGGFLMTGQEIATAVKDGATPILLVFDNGMYGTIRMHQEKHYPGRVSGTDLLSPDFAALAKSYGAHAETVDRTADFPAALTRARAAGRVALLHLKMDPQQLAPGKTLADFSKPAS